jgi:hypothetical protein
MTIKKYDCALLRPLVSMSRRKMNIVVTVVLSMLEESFVFPARMLVDLGGRLLGLFFL